MSSLHVYIHILFCLIMESCIVGKELFPVSIIHINDFHARFEETDVSAAPCSDATKCIGGYARIVTTVKDLQAKHMNSNPIYLNAGDNFQGTLWYTIGRWNVTSHFLNMLPADAITLGNHEFDHGIEGVIPFLETIQSPVVVANIDDTEEPTLQGKYKKSIVIEKYGRKIGVIGVILQSTDEIANTGNLKFTNETEAVRAEAERLKTHHGVDIIIVLSHCGLEVDRRIAQNAGPLIDVIVGGHSHTFLYTGDNPPGPDTPRDVYPIEVVNNGHKVLIVQASCYAKYVGDITVFFNEEGNIEDYTGAPIFLSTDIAQDNKILNELKPWKDVIDNEGKRVVGKSFVTLTKSTCSYKECNLGNLVTDAFVHSYMKEANFKETHWTNAAISICNVGGIRTTLNKGVLTFAHLVTALPFENTVDAFDLLGKYLLEALEYAVAMPSNGEEFSSANMLQVSGLKIVYNTTNAVGKRVVNVEVRCQKCLYPKYEPLDHNAKYRVIAASFLAGGGDGFKMINDNKENLRTGAVDINILTKYIENFSPITAGEDNRLLVLK